ncbi:nucleotide sugar dehydrogenase [Pseudomonadota bacterium]
MLAVNKKVAVVGLGYVGLPLAVAFGAKFQTIGYDSDENKVVELLAYHDPTGEVSETELRATTNLGFTSSADRIGDADYIIIAVPTPVDEAHRPDFGPLIAASNIVGRHMKRGATIVFESTVYPGATEDQCIPELEKVSKMLWKADFNIAYSPERINPGDSEHSLTKIVKLVAGDSPKTLEATAELYEEIIEAGVFRVSSIKVAEAAKVIENTQRDLNIALVNELAIIFNHLDIDTVEVLEAAGTKWNFLPFKPGLVGGHCIGVDPYYLTHKAEMLGYHPQIILAGRHINDSMGKYIAEQTVKVMIRSGCQITGNKVIVLGLSFKENCADLRNSQTLDLISELKDYGLEVFVQDEMVDPDEAFQQYGISLSEWENLPKADAIVAAVAHQSYLEKSIEDLTHKLQPSGCFIDVKSAFQRTELEDAGITVWRL